MPITTFPAQAVKWNQPVNGANACERNIQKYENFIATSQSTRSYGASTKSLRKPVRQIKSLAQQERNLSLSLLSS